jgi:predicted O-methyltransferase YrrM
LFCTTSRQAIKMFDNAIDFLFVDGDHSRTGIFQDCVRYLPRVKPGGLVAFHDYNHSGFPHIKQIVDDRTQGWDTVCIFNSLKVFRKPNEE